MSTIVKEKSKNLKKNCFFFSFKKLKWHDDNDGNHSCDIASCVPGTCCRSPWPCWRSTLSPLLHPHLAGLSLLGPPGKLHGKLPGIFTGTKQVKSDNFSLIHRFSLVVAMSVCLSVCPFSINHWLSPTS